MHFVKSRHRKASNNRRGSRRRRGRELRLAGKGDLVMAAVYAAILSLFGGGLVSWSLSYIVLASATLVFVLLWTWRGGLTALARLPLLTRLALVGIAILPLLQIVPLPPALWQALPGQELRHTALALASLGETWQPMTLEPISTAMCAVLAVGFAAFTALTSGMSQENFRSLLTVVFGLMLLGILAGLLQVVTDGQFPQMQADNMGATMLGFFANKNHMALAIACSILLFGFAVSYDVLAPQRRRPAVVGYTILALICIVTTNSRAGLGLGVLAAICVGVKQFHRVRQAYRIAAILFAIVLVVIVATSSAFEVVSNRVGDVGSDLRWQFTQWSLPLARQYWVFGSGMETFKTLFETQERLDWLRPTYVNAVHNDYLQLLIEGGLPGLAVLSLLVASLIGPIRTFRRMSRREPRRLEMAFGLSVLVLFALHSAVDYPLRRPAAWVLFALGLAAVQRRQGSSQRDVPTP